MAFSSDEILTVPPR